ncbi:TonB-dependent receptor [Sphingomonas azotifigens]|uniref:TonB-dependent receptor n=1 Tax=Sphingomonas azotifigens TaxID=330920 RepID=UPI0009FF845F|nr:TonB-dependent receptor [Sphingomonas azotifigens]
MLRRSTTILLLSTAAIAAMPVPAFAARSAATARVRFDIPAGDLAAALNAVARQSGIRIAFPYDRAAGRRVAGLKGEMAAADAVRRLVAGTDLKLVVADADHILLAAEPSQQAPSVETAASDAGEEIFVTGYRLSTRRALASKRKSDQVIDAVSQDEVSQLPDVNIVEAARRIPGLSVISERDSTRGHDNYQYVTIRGLDSRYNLVTVDGAQVASADASYRGAQLAMLPATLVSEIQAIKTVTAQYDPHALGGQINLVSKSAFDTGPFVTAQALGGWTSQGGKVVPDKRANLRASATAATTFGSAHQFGVVLSGEYQRLQASALASLPGDTGGAGWTYYTAAGAQTANIAASTGRAVPVRVQDYAFDVQRERYSVNGKLEFRPGDRFEASLFGGYYRERSDEDRYEALALPAAGYTPGASADTGKLNSGNYQLGLVAQPETRKTWFVNGSARYAIADRLKLRVGASDSDATYNQNRWMYKWNTGMVITATSAGTSNQPAYGYGYRVVGGEPIITLNDAAAAANPANYGPRYWRNIVADITNTVRTLRGDLGWNFDPEDRGLGLNLGVNHTLTRVENTLDYREWFAKDAASAALIGTLDRYAQPMVLTPIMAPGINFYLIDAVKAQGVLVDHPDWFRQSTARVADSNNAYFKLRESIAAGYGQIRWRADRFNLQAGLRYDDTAVDVTTRVNGTSRTLQRHRDYGYALPSAVATFDATAAIKLRAGVSETIGRPDYGQYGATTTYSVNAVTNPDGSPASLLTITQGNAALRPRRAWNYDLSAEWYLGRGGLVSAALFRKDITDEIFTKTISYTNYAFEGTTYQSATVSQPVNASSARVQGIEVQLVQDKLDFLPGPLRDLGVSLNASWLDGHFDFVMSNGSNRRIGALFNQPDHIYNASLFYSRGPANVRFAWNRIGAAPVSVDSGAAWRDIWQDARDQIDLQGSYYVTPWLQATAQVQNLTKAPFRARLGEQRELLQTRYPVGRTLWFGLVFKPGVAK